MVRAHIKPKLLRWARERAGYSLESLVGRFPKIEEWESGDINPTIKQLEKYAKTTHTPIGFLFLPEPPVEQIPIPDFRTMASAYVDHPSPDLLETIYICQQRQEWYRDYARMMGESPLPFVGSANTADDIIATAGSIRQKLGFEIEERRHLRTWTEALRLFVDQADQLGILVMSSGIVGNNTHRRLEPEEFRGFALSDRFAPLIFINGTDTKSGQMFTLAHELAHIWLGQTGISDVQAVRIPDQAIERWCNQVAAEILVPLDIIKSEYHRSAELAEEMKRFARVFKVSTLVILRRLYDAGILDWQSFQTKYDQEVVFLRAIITGSGGDFYRTQTSRLSKRFLRALVSNTLEGQTLYRDAFRMLGIKKAETFHQISLRLGVE